VKHHMLKQGAPPVRPVCRLSVSFSSLRQTDDGSARALIRGLCFWRFVFGWTTSPAGHMRAIKSSTVVAGQDRPFEAIRDRHRLRHISILRQGPHRDPRLPITTTLFGLAPSAEHILRRGGDPGRRAAVRAPLAAHAPAHNFSSPCVFPSVRRRHTDGRPASNCRHTLSKSVRRSTSSVTQ
jgi:hypothetical protein